MNEILILAIMKFSFINICTIIIDYKIINKKLTYVDFAKIFCEELISLIIYVLLRNYIDNILMIIITYLLQVTLLKIVIKDNKNSLYIINLISSAITYIAFGVSMLFESIIIMMMHINNKIVNLLCGLIIESIIIHLLFKIKRFKNGFMFLQTRENNEYFNIIMINISAVIILAYYLFGNYYGNLTKQLTLCFIILGIIMFIMIQKTLTLYYKQKLLAKNIEDYKTEIAEKDEQIKKLADEKFKISKLNHEFYNRQKALEKKVQDFIENASTETASELSVIKSINNLSKEYSEELEEIKNLDKLPSTGIEEIDDMFKYMQSECKKNNIDFKLQVNGKIHHMVNKLIPQNKLVTLIGDHIRDAIIAINSGTNKFRSIIAIIGSNNQHYEFCVYDTGIEFKIDTLLKLGLEPATTHKETGGNGIGFMTTFETMKETNASLIINEIGTPSMDDYTKSVTIRFDGKNEYRICSYRHKKIEKKNKDNRIIIK